MPAKRSWRPPRLLLANVLVYGATGVLCLLFGREILWGQHTLRAYLGFAPFHPTADTALLTQAFAAIRAGAPPADVEALAQRARAIEPHGDGRTVLASVRVRQGRIDEALALLEAALADDPADYDVYRQLIPVLARTDQRERFIRLVDRGIAAFAARVARYRPRPDPSVDDKYNRKARRIYESDRRALQELRGLRDRAAAAGRNETP